MKGSDLLTEHALSRRLTQADIDAFAAEGIPLLALAQSQFGDYAVVCKDKVVFDGDRFEFSRYRPDGACNAFVLPALDHFGEVIDLVAFRHDRCATWFGRAGLLGGEQPFLPRVGDVALDVHESVIDWLRAGRRGVVVINLARAASDLRAAAPLRAATPEHARRLRTALTVPAPTILIRGKRESVPVSQGGRAA